MGTREFIEVGNTNMYHLVTFTRYAYSVIKSSILVGQLTPVSTLTVIPLGPWSVFISWKAPQGKQALISEYYLTGDVTATVPSSGQKYLFYFADKNIEPGADVAVSVFANYINGGKSPYLTTIGTTPIPRKLHQFVLRKPRPYFVLVLAAAFTRGGLSRHH